jgi:hypothetical protein
MSILTRFIYSKRHFFPNGGVKPDAFMPGKAEVEISVLACVGMSADEIWAQGRALRKPPLNVHGKAELPIPLLRELKLDAQPTPEPPNPHNHYSLLGWPGGELDRLAIAQELAAISTPTRLPVPIPCTG